jgi:hypothetical protein
MFTWLSLWLSTVSMRLQGLGISGTINGLEQYTIFRWFVRVLLLEWYLSSHRVQGFLQRQLIFWYKTLGKICVAVFKKCPSLLQNDLLSIWFHGSCGIKANMRNYESETISRHTCPNTGKPYFSEKSISVEWLFRLYKPRKYNKPINASSSPLTFLKFSSEGIYHSFSILLNIINSFLDFHVCWRISDRSRHWGITKMLLLCLKYCVHISPNLVFQEEYHWPSADQLHFSLC